MGLDLTSLEQDYRRDGFVLLPGFLPPDLVARLRATTHGLRARVRDGEDLGEEFDVVDGDDGRPDIRRITPTETVDPVYDEVLRHPELLEVVAGLLGGTVRLDHTKLNFKAETGSSTIEWHQDWAFYPQTNDDVLAVGVMIDDCTPENGPMMVVPGTHTGPVHDHHNDGYFVGGIRNADIADQLDDAVPMVGPAGSVSIHHVRTLHGSAPNRGDGPRPLLLISYQAVDAFPVFHSYDIDEFDSRILVGEPTREPRTEHVPIRVPVPTPPAPDHFPTPSLFLLQQAMDDPTFADA